MQVPDTLPTSPSHRDKSVFREMACPTFALQLRVETALWQVQFLCEEEMLEAGNNWRRPRAAAWRGCRGPIEGQKCAETSPL